LLKICKQKTIRRHIIHLDIFVQFQ
jgi:hypothetical protein